MKIQKIITNIFPKTLAVIYIIFIALLSLDVFNFNASFLEKMGGLLIHNIPTILLLASLFLAWAKPAKGGIAFVLLSIAFTLFFKTYQRLDAFILISLPLLLIGILFILNKEKNEHN